MGGQAQKICMKYDIEELHKKLLNSCEKWNSDNPNAPHAHKTANSLITALRNKLINSEDLKL